jgi:hypothetical protein
MIHRFLRKDSSLLKNSDCRLLKKTQRRGAQFSLFAFVVRVRKTSTSNEHDSREAIERNDAYEAFHQPAKVPDTFA